MFVCGKYYSIIDRSKDSSHDLQTNCIINFYFYLNLILHICAVRFDVTENLEFFKLNKAIVEDTQNVDEGRKRGATGEGVLVSRARRR